MAFDFARLNDPTLRAEQNKIRALEAEKQEQQEKKQRQALHFALLAYDSLPSNERSFVQTCQSKLSGFGSLSEKQASWLQAIGDREEAKYLARRVSVIEEAAGGDMEGQHAMYPRARWHEFNLGETSSEQYWDWVLLCLDLDSRPTL